MRDEAVCVSLLSSLLSSPPSDILLVVAGQPLLLYSSLKCKITISEIENGWLGGGPGLEGGGGMLVVSFRS